LFSILTEVIIESKYYVTYTQNWMFLLYLGMKYDNICKDMYM